VLNISASSARVHERLTETEGVAGSFGDFPLQVVRQFPQAVVSSDSLRLFEGVSLDIVVGPFGVLAMFLVRGPVSFGAARRAVDAHLRRGLSLAQGTAKITKTASKLTLHPVQRFQPLTEGPTQLSHRR
jgi:hypothetical protein